MARKESPASEFAIYFLATLCLLSVSLNIFLLIGRRSPGFWNDLRLSFKKPLPVSAADHIRGSSSAPVTIIEFSDFQCPYCKQMNTDLKHLSTEMPVRWVLRQNPLESIHPLALKAAVASECAAVQGKFWEYSDALFDNQSALTSELFLSEVARRLDLKEPEFESCRNSSMTDFVRSQMAQASRIEVSMTPTLFINGKRYTGAVQYDELAKLISK